MKRVVAFDHEGKLTSPSIEKNGFTLVMREGALIVQSESIWNESFPFASPTIGKVFKGETHLGQFYINVFEQNVNTRFMFLLAGRDGTRVADIYTAGITKHGIAGGSPAVLSAVDFRGFWRWLSDAVPGRYFFPGDTQEASPRRVMEWIAACKKSAANYVVAR